MDDYQRHPGVDAYIEALPEWQRDICRQLRDIAHAADPDIEETIKRRVQPYFVLDGNICALLAAKDHVNLFLYDGAIRPRPGGHHHRRARKQVGQDGRVLAGRRNPTARPDRDAQADHRQQSRRRLEQAQEAIAPSIKKALRTSSYPLYREAAVWATARRRATERKLACFCRYATVSRQVRRFGREAALLKTAPCPSRDLSSNGSYRPLASPVPAVTQPEGMNGSTYAWEN